MIDNADQRMLEWAQSVAGKVKVSLEMAPAAVGGTGVSIYLMEILSTPTMRLVREPEPFKLTLRYLVTSWAGSAEEAHRMLGQLIFAALKMPEMEVEAEAVPHSVWQSFGQPVRPSFVVRVPLVLPRAIKRAPRVRHPLVIHHSPMRPLRGQILGPGDVAITDALIEVPALNLSTRTDDRGRFIFAAVPSQPPIQLLRVHAKGRQIDVPSAEQARSAEPLVIHLNENQL